MVGAIAGDMIGSIYEHSPVKSKSFPLFSPASRFTDDSVLALAIAEAILKGASYLECMKKIGRRYPNAGYGERFRRWLLSEETTPCNSWGNGAAMRVSAVGFAFDSETAVLREAAVTAKVTHNHPEGVKGAQATALAVFLARRQESKNSIRTRLEQCFGYNLTRRIDDIRPDYSFDVSCQGTVPEAIIAFIDSESWEDAVRNAVSLGGDADTLACITGAVAEAWYGGVPDTTRQNVNSLLPADLGDILLRFEARYGM